MNKLAKIGDAIASHLELSPSHSLTDPLTGVGAWRCYCREICKEHGGRGRVNVWFVRKGGWVVKGGCMGRLRWRGLWGKSAAVSGVILAVPTGDSLDSNRLHSLYVCLFVTITFMTDNCSP